MRGRALRHARVIAFALAGLSFMGSMLVGHLLFARLSADNDEAVYMLESEVLAHGHLTLSDAVHGDAFRPWMSGRVDGHLVLVEQPVLPALMAASDRLFGSPRVALGLIAAGAVLAIFAMTRQLVRHDAVAIVAAAVFALSPFVIVQSALFLSYVLAVMLAALVILLIDLGLRRESQRLLLAAGLLQGLLFFTRPFDSILYGIAIAGWLVMRRLPWRALGRAIGTVALGALPLVVVCLGYNALTTGSPLRFPLWSIGGRDSFGFGDRVIAEGGPVTHFGPGESFLALRTNLRSFPHWVFGGLVCLPVLVYGAVVLWRMQRAVFGLLVGIAAVIPVGYMFYWGNYLVIGGRNEYGPHYYLGLLIPAAVLVAVGTIDLVSRRTAWAAALVPLVLLGTAVEVGDKLDRNRSVRDDTEREAAAVARAVHSPAVVVLPASIDGPYVLHPRGAFRNPPDLQASVLFAVDLQGRNAELFDRYRDRRIYRLQELDTGFGPRVDMTALTRLTGPVDVTLDVAHQPVRDAYVLVAGRRLPCDPSHVAVHVMDHGLIAGGVVVPLRDGPATIALGVDIGDQTYEARYWLDVHPLSTSVITPADIWHRPAGDDTFDVLDPTVAPWLATAAMESG